jgi:hypothetical protein
MSRKSTSYNDSQPSTIGEHEGEESEALSIEQEVFAKVHAKTKGLRPELMTGAAAMYDLSSYDGDYTAGGQLSARFVNNDESRIAILRNKGYDVPSAWSSRLKDLRIGNQVLMLRPRKMHEDYLNHRRSLAAQIAGNDSPTNSPVYDEMAQHVIKEQTGYDRQDVQLPEDMLVAD